MGLFVHIAVPLICTFVFRRSLRQPAGRLFIEGLRAYFTRASALPTPLPGPNTSKRDRKLMQKRQLDLKGGTTSIILQQLGPSAVAKLYTEPSTFGENFELLGTLLLVLFVGVAAHFTLGPLINLWQDVLLWTLGPFVAVWAVWQLLLLQADGSPARLLRGDRLHVLLAAGLAAMAAYGILTAAPRGWFRPGWDAVGAARDFDRLFNTGMARLYAARMRRHIPPPPLESDPHTVAAVLAAVAGALAAGLLGSAIRVAKLFSYISPPPHWGERYLSPGPLSAAAIRLALALPAAVVLYGIRPAVDFWGPAASAAAAGVVLGPALVALTAAAQILAVRPLTAAHLGSGLLEYHLVRHSAVAQGSSGSASANHGSAEVRAASPAMAAIRDELLRKRLVSVYATVCQAALQLLAPATIMVCLALMYGAAAGPLNSFRPPQPILFDITARRLPPPPPPAAAPPAAPAASAADGVPILEGLDEVVSAAGAAATAAAAAVAEAVTEALPPLPPLDFVRNATEFLAWWACAAQCLFTYPLLFVYRTGLHVG